MLLNHITFFRVECYASAVFLNVTCNTQRSIFSMAQTIGSEMPGGVIPEESLHVLLHFVSVTSCKISPETEPIHYEVNAATDTARQVSEALRAVEIKRRWEISYSVLTPSASLK